MIYTASDLCALKQLRDSPERVSQLKGNWDKVLGNMSTALDPNTLRDVRVDQMGKSKEVESDM